MGPSMRPRKQDPAPPFGEGRKEEPVPKGVIKTRLSLTVRVITRQMTVSLKLTTGHIQMGLSATQLGKPQEHHKVKDKN